MIRTRDEVDTTSHAVLAGNSGEDYDFGASLIVVLLSASAPSMGRSHLGGLQFCKPRFAAFDLRAHDAANFVIGRPGCQGGRDFFQFGG